MAQYINKSTLVAEIERRLEELYELLPDAGKVEKGIITISEACNTGKYTALESFKDYIDTLEVKEVDLEEEMDKHWDEWAKADGFHSTEFAKHFFELGMNVKLKGIDTTHNIDAILEEKGIDIESREAKAFKEAFYNAIDTYLPKAQKGK